MILNVISKFSGQQLKFLLFLFIEHCGELGGIGAMIFFIIEDLSRPGGTTDK